MATPVVQALTPADGATSVLPSTTLVLDFTANVQVGTGNVRIVGDTQTAPTLQGRTTDNTGTADVTSFQIDWTAPGGGFLDNDIIAIAISKDDGAGTFTSFPPTNWNSSTDTANGTAVRVAFIWRRVTAGFSGTSVTVTGDSESYAARVWLIRGADASTDPFCPTPATGTSAAANSPLATFPWGTEPTLVLAIVGGDGNGSTTGYPAGYGNTGTLTSGHTTTGSRSWLGYAELASTTAGSEDPGAFTNTNIAWVALTVAFRAAVTHTTLETIAITNRTKVSFASDLVTIRPAIGTLALNTNYHIEIDSGAILDAGDSASWPGYSDTTSWNFTTDDGAVKFVDCTTGFVSAGVVAVPTGNVGDILAAFGIDVDTPPDGGWTQRDEIPGLEVPVRLWTKIRTASEGSGGNYTFGGGGAQPIVVVLAMRGAVEAPNDTGWTFNTTASMVTEDNNVARDGSMFVLFQGGSAGTTTGVPAGMTEREDTNDLIELWTETRAAGTTGTRTTTLSEASFWITFTAVFTPKITGAVFATPPAPQADARGTPIITGSVAAPLPATTTDVRGRPVVTGSVAAPLPGTQGDVRGTPVVTGSVAASLPAVQTSIIPDNTLETSVAATLPATQADVRGTPVVTGSVAASLPGTSGDVRGSPVVTGSVSSSLPAIQATVQGTTITRGSVAAPLPATQGDVRGSPVVTGSVASPLPATQANVQGRPVVIGSVAAPLPATQGDVRGSPVTTGSVAATLPGTQGDVRGSPVTTGSVAAPLPATQATVQGTTIVRGSVAAPLPATQADVRGTPVVTGSVSATLPATQGDVRGSPVVTGSVGATLPGVQASIFEEEQENEGIVSASLPATQADVRGTPIVTGSVAAPLPATQANVQGSPVVTGSVAAPLPATQATVQGTTIVRGSVAAPLPATQGDVRGTPIVTGSVGATLPATFATVVTALAQIVEVQDAVSVTDGATASRETHVLFNDSIACTDTCSVGRETHKVVSDAVTATDGYLFRETVFPQDALAVTDTVARGRETHVNPSDTIACTDESSANLEFGALSDSVTLTDQCTTITWYSKTLSDSILVSDTCSTALGYAKTLTDTIACTDTCSVSLGYGRTLSDSSSVTDNYRLIETVFLRDEIVILDGEREFDGQASDAVLLTDQCTTVTSYVRFVSDASTISDSILTGLQYFRSVPESPIALSDSVTAFVQSDVGDAIDITDQVGFAASYALTIVDAVGSISDQLTVDTAFPRDSVSVTDTSALSVFFDRKASDAVNVLDQQGALDRFADDVRVHIVDGAYCDLIPREGMLAGSNDTATLADVMSVELFTPLPATMATDGLSFEFELPQEVRYDYLQKLGNFELLSVSGRAPNQLRSVEPITTVERSGNAGQIVYQGGQNFFSNVFRTSGADVSSSSVSGHNVTALDEASVSDSYTVQVFGPNAVSRTNGFTSSDVNGYLELLSGPAPGRYRIISVLSASSVEIDRALPVGINGLIDWRVTSAVQSLRITTVTKMKNQENYELRAKGLLTRDGIPYDFVRPFYTQGIHGPRIVQTTVTDDGIVMVEFDQEMLLDQALTSPSDYVIIGETPVQISRVWTIAPNAVALKTVGLTSGSYNLNINFSGTPKDLGGNPLDPDYSIETFLGTVAVRSRSVFTDKGPIAKPPLVLQAGFGATLASATEVTLPGASLNGTHVGRYLRLGPQGLPPTTSSNVVGTAVTVNDTAYASDDVRIELNSRVVYATLQGTYRIEGVVSSTRARVQASFSVPNQASGFLYWELFDPRDGEIANDPSDVLVRINGAAVVPESVNGLLGQIILEDIPDPSDDVKVDYSWACNPTVEFRGLNSHAFRLNSWNRDMPDTGQTQHRYRYNNVLVRPEEYESVSVLARIDQPELRSLYYRAYERAYTPVLNDPSLMLLNSPIHKIAFPASQRTLEEQFIVYEATALPENSTDPWIRHGVGAASVTTGILTVIDNVSGPFPTGQPIFWTRAIDLTFPSAFALSWRFVITAVPTFEGVFTGLAAGYADDLTAYVVGFLTVGGVRKVGFLKRGSADDPSLVASWTGGIDTSGDPTGAPADFDWSVIHSYRIFKDLNGVVRLYVDGNVVETLRILPNEAPFLEELNAPFNEIQGAFFGSISRQSESTSQWDFVRYLILPTNPVQTSPSSFVNYEGTVIPEVDAKPWTPVGYHGTETILSNDFLLLDSTSATDEATEAEMALMGGAFKGFVRMEPLLTSASQVVLDVNVQLRTYTHGVDPYGLMFAVDDGTRLTQVALLAHQSTPKLSYGGGSFPEDFSPFVWTSLGTATAALAGRILRITDATVGDGLVYFIEDTELPASDDRVIAAGTDYFLEFRNKVISYTVDGSGFAGAFGQVFDGTRSVGILLAEVSGTHYVRLHSDGVTIASFVFNWGDSNFHTYRIAKSTGGDLVSLFIDNVFIGTASYSSFTASTGAAMVSFGSSTPASSSARSVVDWAYCNVWRTRSDLKRYVGIWKGYDSDLLTGYHLPLKASGPGAQVAGNALGDTQANFLTANVVSGDRLIVDVGPNKGVYEVASVGSATTLTIVGTWPSSPTIVSYRIVKETNWTVANRYRINRTTTGEVVLLFNDEVAPLIRVGYNSIDLPNSGVGIVKTLSNGLAAIAFGSFSPENLEQSSWDYVRYGITRSPTELRIAPHHQVLNQWNVMESPERLYTALPHELTSYKSSSTGIVPKKEPDFLKDPALPAFTQLNDSTPLVPSTQTFEVREPFPIQEFVAALNRPEDVLNTDGDFVLNNGAIRYRLIVPDDVLYTSLDVITQTTGDDAPIAAFGESCGPMFRGMQYQKESCLSYDADSNVLPENDATAASPWIRESTSPVDVTATVSGGVLTYRTVGSKTVYKNNTALPDAPGLQTEARFRLRLVDDATLGTGDTQVRFGLSAPGLTVALAFVTTPAAERYVLVVDLNNGAYLGSVSFDFLDGNFHDYRITRDPGAGVVRVAID